MGVKRGFVFSLDAFFAVLIVIFALGYLILSSRGQLHQLSVSMQAKLLASDALDYLIRNYDPTDEEEFPRICATLSQVFSRSAFDFSFEVEGKSTGCEKPYGNLSRITAQAAYVLVVPNVTGRPRNPYKYKTCSGDLVACTLENETSRVEVPRPTKVRVVVFI